ncbi:hypothetical protein D3C71_1143860 [compost metagenome]
MMASAASTLLTEPTLKRVSGVTGVEGAVAFASSAPKASCQTMWSLCSSATEAARILLLCMASRISLRPQAMVVVRVGDAVLLPPQPGRSEAIALVPAQVSQPRRDAGKRRG